jgi:hypothetical protein
MSVPLYDVARALGDLDRYRATATSDPLAAQSTVIADKLAAHMARHFPNPEDRRVAGAALIILAASITQLQDIRIEVVSNVTGLTGQQLHGDVAR